MGIEMPDGKGG